jgi:hypothetical protein
MLEYRGFFNTYAVAMALNTAQKQGQGSTPHSKHGNAQHPPQTIGCLLLLQNIFHAWQAV